MKRGSRISRVLSFFREGSEDEIKAVLLIMQAEGMFETFTDAFTPAKPRTKRAYRKRLNGADSTHSTESHLNKMEASA
jgi:hypothetical protein